MNIEYPRFKPAVDYLPEIRDASTIDQAFEAFALLTSELNFWYTYSDNIEVGQIGRKPAGIESYNLPNAWVMKYLQEGYILSDPVLEWCMARRAPATFASIAAHLNKQNHPIWADAKAHGIHDGLAFSFQIRNAETLGLISLASARPIQRHEFAVAISCAKYFVAACHFLQHGVAVPTGTQDDRFDQTDLDILYNVRMGLSDDEIAQCLGMTRQTINKRITKMKTVTLTDRRLGPALVFDWLGYF